MAKLKDVYNFQCKVFEPATSELSEKELKIMLKQLYEYFPYTYDGDGNKKPYATDNDYSKKWYKCYDHLLSLLSMKKQEFRYKLSLILSIVAIVVSVIGVAVRITVSG
ncbi:hypothetical protein NGM67_10610 [Photobacterium damselae]|uniref:hypothetical protein n=1 Tax=Photobacterium damselae TaxID=38293 RepID=UPI00209060F6|nr:hypothetical protein [Photobacterium damselae]USR78199.1 hypothetical protein NGM67_10610 [Photobacterium damselae]